MNFKYTISYNDLENETSLNNATEIAIDGEFNGLDVQTCSLNLLQLSDGSDHVYFVKFEGDYNSPNLKKILENTKIKKIFHFGRADLGFIKKHLNINVKNIFDTKIASKISRKYTSSHGLKDLCSDLLNIKLKKDAQSSDWGKPWDDYSEDMISYAGSDVIYLHRIKKELEKILIRENKHELAEKCFQFLETRTDLDLCGLGDIFEH